MDRGKISRLSLPNIRGKLNLITPINHKLGNYWSMKSMVKYGSNKNKLIKILILAAPLRFAP